MGRLVHEEGEEGDTVEDGLFEAEGLVLQFAAEGGAAAVLFAGELAFHAAFVGDEEAFFALGVEVNPAVLALEVFVGMEGAMGEQIERHGIGHRSAERLDEVEGQGGSSVGGFMQEADGRVQADGVEFGLCFGGEQGVGEGKNGIGSVVGWAAGAAFKGSGFGKKAPIGLEVFAGGGAFMMGWGSVP
jgi:hypothetical protein